MRDAANQKFIFELIIEILKASPEKLVSWPRRLPRKPALGISYADDTILSAYLLWMIGFM